MNTSTGITIWDISCPLGRKCAILFNPAPPGISLAVFNSAVRPGRWRLGTDGLAGAMNNDRSTYKRSSITVGSLFFLGLGSSTLQAVLLDWLSRVCQVIGSAVTGAARSLWKRWWTESDSKGPAIGRPIGPGLARQLGVGGWTGTINRTAQRSKRFLSTPFPCGSVRNCRDCSRGKPWERPLAYLRRVRERNFAR